MIDRDCMSDALSFCLRDWRDPIPLYTFGAQSLETLQSCPCLARGIVTQAMEIINSPRAFSVFL